jgi:hypothetical protein
MYFKLASLSDKAKPKPYLPMAKLPRKKQKTLHISTKTNTIIAGYLPSKFEFLLTLEFCCPFMLL